MPQSGADQERSVLARSLLAMAAFLAAPGLAFIASEPSVGAPLLGGALGLYQISGMAPRPAAKGLARAGIIGHRLLIIALLVWSAVTLAVTAPLMVAGKLEERQASAEDERRQAVVCKAAAQELHAREAARRETARSNWGFADCPPRYLDLERAGLSARPSPVVHSSGRRPEPSSAR